MHHFFEVGVLLELALIIVGLWAVAGALERIRLHNERFTPPEDAVSPSDGLPPPSTDT